MTEQSVCSIVIKSAANLKKFVIIKAEIHFSRVSKRENCDLNYEF